MLVHSRQSTTRWYGSLLASLTLLGPSADSAAVRAGEKAAAPMVPGFARFHADAKVDAVKGGQLLLGELNCISCHASANKANGNVMLKTAPILDHVGSRVKRSYLLRFLGDPQGVKPGTTMPNVFAGLEEQDKKAKVEALVHFLASTGTPKQERLDKKGIASGRDLYHKVGCVACHGTRDAKGDQDKTFATTVALGNLKAKYTLASLQGFLQTPHQVRPSGRMPGLLTPKESVEVANYLMQGTAPLKSVENMTYSYYEVSGKNLPDFGKLKPQAVGQTTDFDLSVARRMNDCALKFEGFLKIDTQGSYMFHVTSDDGSKLWIDGKLVVDNDGVHAPATKSGKVKLAKGMHKLVAGVFNASAGFELGIEVEGPGIGRQPLGPLVHLQEKEDAVPVAKEKDPEQFPLQPELIAKGKEFFASLGCANCHQMPKEEKRLDAPGLEKLTGVGGCLDAAPKKGVPWYNLNAAQQTALKAAIQVKEPTKLDAKEIVARTMTTFNCYACHERGKVGGVEEDVNKFFLTSQPEMGDEARIPPSLDGVGAKLKSTYMKKIFDQGAHDRPYMLTRMPRFGDANVGYLVGLYASLDPTQPAPKVVFNVPVAKVKAAARQMMDPKKGFGCIQCHTFAGSKALGVQGIDMTLMTERLNHDWYFNYVLDPNKYRPGTRMPTSFPDGMTPFKKILDGKADTQIEAIWTYLLDGKSAAVPLALNSNSIPLIPTTEAIIYRNFIQGAGPRAIGVGYPEKAHLAFDANDVRLALIWQGQFMDARRHWTGRGEGFEPPMGDNILSLPAGAAFAVLSQPDEPWPTTSPKQQGVKFVGFRLNDDQRPTFLYAAHGVKFEDYPTAVETKGNPSIRRVITMTAENPVEKLYYRAAVADKIEAVGDGWYRINDWRMRIESAAMPEIRRVGNKMELLVPVRFKGNGAKIVQEYVW